LYIIKVGSDWKDGLDPCMYIIKVGSDLKDGLNPCTVGLEGWIKCKYCILLRLDRTERMDKIHVLYIIKVGSDWRDGLDPCIVYYEGWIGLERWIRSLYCILLRLDRIGRMD